MPFASADAPETGRASAPPIRPGGWGPPQGRAGLSGLRLGAGQRAAVPRPPTRPLGGARTELGRPGLPAAGQAGPRPPHRARLLRRASGLGRFRLPRPPYPAPRGPPREGHPARATPRGPPREGHPARATPREPRESCRGPRGPPPPAPSHLPGPASPPEGSVLPPSGRRPPSALRRLGATEGPDDGPPSRGTHIAAPRAGGCHAGHLLQI